VVVWASASLRYDDGKTLKGMGTRASKSRLTAFQCERRSSRKPFRQAERKTRRGLLLLWLKEGEEESVCRTLLDSIFQLRDEGGGWTGDEEGVQN
jgi:hypothetical protein